MKRRLYIIIVCLLALIFSKPAMALGIGAYFDGGVGESELKAYYTHSSTFYTYGKYFHGINYLYGGGFMLDTYIDEDKLFNYRFQFGCEGYTYPRAPSLDWPQYNYTPKLSHTNSYRFNMKNTFGFKLFRNELLRLWIGLRITSYCPYYQNHWKSYDESKYKIGFILPGLFVPGLVIGLNIHLNEMISLTAESSVNYEWSVSKAVQDGIASVNCHFAIGVLYRMNVDHHKKNIRLQDVSQQEINSE